MKVATVFVASLSLGFAQLLGCRDSSTGGSGTGEQNQSTALDALEQEVERGPVKVILRLSPKAPRLSDEPELAIIVEAKPGITVEMPEFDASLGPFLIRNYSNPTPLVKDGLTVYRQSYRLEPVAVGEVQIVSIPIDFIDNRDQGDGERHTIETGPMTVEIGSMLADEAPSLADLRPPEPALALPAPAPRYGRYLWPVAAVLLVAFGMIIAWRRRAKKQPERVYTPTELAERELRDLAGRDLLAHGDVKTYYVEITGIVRRYIERTTGLKAPEQTTQEFLRTMHTHQAFAEPKKLALGAFLEAADLVKFAAHQPDPAELELTDRKAREFVGLSAPPVTERAA